MALDSADSLKQALESRHSQKLRELEQSQIDRSNELVMFYTKQIEDKDIHITQTQGREREKEQLVSEQ